MFNANHGHIEPTFCSAFKDISVKFLMVNFKDLLIEMNAGGVYLFFFLLFFLEP